MKTCPACAVENSDASLRCSACRALLGPATAKAATRSVQPGDLAPESDSDSSVHGRFLPGTRIAERYRIVSLAGRGGMGEVYRADDLKLGHPVALKFLPREVEEGSRSFQHFLGEVRLSRQIAHPNVCRVHDIAEVDGQHFLSMEYIDGEDLKGLLRRIGRLPRDKGIQIAQQLCAGLAAAHEKGVLHRDLKPANVMIDGRGQARITDFGLARLADGAAGADEIAGTPAYMAPEQLARGETTIQSDLYSLGLILHEVFTGQPVHHGDSLRQVMRSHQDSTPTPPSTLVHDIDPAVERTILRCLEKDPGQRPRSARAVAAGLPGGDPLAAALAAGETPSPEMVAAAGEQGAIEKWRGLCCLAAVAVGLALVCWLGQRTYLVNQVGLERHPESLADSARQMIAKLGYTDPPAQQAHGFRHEGKEAMRFWYRQSPEAWPAGLYFSGWNEESFARIDPGNPPWFVPGELGVELDLAGKLIRLRAIPGFKPDSPKVPARPEWSEWFPKELTGFDLAAQEPIDRGVPPPDASDQMQAWKCKKPGSGGDFYVQAAAYAGKPVYFSVFSPAEFEGQTPSMAMWPRSMARQTSASRQRGESLLFGLVWVMYIGAGVFAWRNFRLGRSDRKGAFRAIFVLVCTGMLSWLLLASHIAGGLEVAVLAIGASQVLWRAATFWLFYLALEPHIRRLWPEVLISWSRLVNGQWRDPLVGRNVLLGVLAGVFDTAVNLSQGPAAAWFGLTPQPFHLSHDVALDGPLALAGQILRQLIESPGLVLFVLMSLFLFRLVLRRPLLASCAYLVVWTVVMTSFFEAHPVLGWFAVGIQISLGLWVYLRLGFLAGIVLDLTYNTLMASPLTTDFSAWYAGIGLAAMAFLLALAAFGYFTSQAGRPIFQEAPVGRTPS
jgi:eukaryotic-like serine/threonine-protein kinase